MAITISDEDFETVYQYFYRSYSATDNEGVADTLRSQDAAWAVLQRIAKEYGRDLPDPREELKAKLQASWEAEQAAKPKVSRRRLPPKKAK
jgi:hypothetical protein